MVCFTVGFPGDPVVKNLPVSSGDARDIGSSSGLGRSPGWQPSPLVLPEKSHGQKSLVGYSPWDHKESDPTKQPNTHTFHCRLQDIIATSIY